MRVQELQKAFDSEDHEAIRFIGHTLAGSAASIGAQELGLVAEAINKLTPQSSSQLRGELFQRLIDTFNTSKQQLLDYRQQQKINQ